MSKLTLLEQLSQLENPTPVDVDPEEAYSSLSAKQKGKGQAIDGAEEEDGSDNDQDGEGRDHYLSVGMSDMRKNADARRREAEDMEKYGGVRRSRAEIFGDSNSGSSEEDEDEDEDEDEAHEGVEDEEVQPFGQVANSSDEEDEDDEDEPSTFPERTPASPPAESTPNLETSQILSSLRNSRSEEQNKGLSVKRQLDLFENFLPLRIKMQKAISGLTGLKDQSAQVELANPSPELQESVNGCIDQILTLSEGLFELQEGLMKLNEPSIELPPSKRRKTEASDVVSSDYILPATEDALALSDLTHPSLLQTLAKWSSKIMTAQGLQNLRGEKFKSVKIGVVEQIGASLEGLEGRKKVDRFMGLVSQDEAECEAAVWGDDKEFYQSLVRDVIERRGGGAGVGAMSGQATFSNYGPKKHKPTLDTRASKGRKLRYTPQEKIMNFMVPERTEDLWQEEQVDELFGSLLGRTIREEIEVDENGEEIETGDAADHGLGGLRVF
ncbi:Apoptosis antagonizing transcription factor/protein transport protein [Phaffia rhodozyma]|uniref:Protein BFR2 n=1 Tax=Phaffia rhodozyma TaxID=264483 RepID=A0A0F7SKG3_PHARH|nr:Apoptosis antagonizing transcription factor/protein transport protein [Phaffia rhodozyma]